MLSPPLPPKLSFGDKPPPQACITTDRFSVGDPSVRLLNYRSGARLSQVN